VGQKTNPIGFRLGISKEWDSYWFDEKDYSSNLEEDLLVRRYIFSRLQNAGVSKIEIERNAEKVTIKINTARPGIVIGRKGVEVDKLKEELKRIVNKNIQLDIMEIKRPELDSHLVAANICRQLEAKISYRRAMKKAIMATMRMGAEGIRIKCSGRLGGAEMARSEWYREGSIPLHTLRADIDFARVTAHTTYGTIGVKVWICNGEAVISQK